MKKTTKNKSVKKQNKKIRKLKGQKRAQHLNKKSTLAPQAFENSIAKDQSQACKEISVAASAKPSAPSVAKPHEKGVASPLPPAKEVRGSSPSKMAFLCFLGIFACMLLLESSRFKVFFEGESGEYPFLRPVGEVVSQVAEATGIAAVMESIGAFTRDASQEYLVVSDTPLQEQWQGAKNFYAALLGIDSPDASVASKEHSSKPMEKKPELPSTETDVTSSDASDLATEEVEPTSPQPSLAEGEQEKTSPTATHVEEEKAKSVVKPAPTYAFYDAKHITAAPSEEAIEEYLTKLPDYGKPLKILIIGDSMMMEGLGPTLQKSLRKRFDVQVVREGRYSSGLSKPDFFNWPENLKKLLEKHNPNLLIISLGANDTQDIMVGKRRFRIDTEGWERVYAIRVINFLELATDNNRKVLWVSLPVMGRMPYANRTRLINAITADMSSFYPAVAYENIEHLLTLNGKYTSFIKDKNNNSIRLRSKDKIHVSTAGGQILTNHILPYADERVDVIRMEEVQGNPLIPVAGKANTVQFTSASRKKNVKYVVYLPQALEQGAQEGALVSTSAGQAVTGLGIAINAAPQGVLSDIAPPSTESNLSVEKAQIALGAPASIIAVQDLHMQRQKGVRGISVESILRHSLQGKHTGKAAEKQKEERFPVLYILHGATGRAEEWNRYLGKELQAIADEKRIIVVAPDAEEHGWYVNSPHVAHSQIESFMIKELVPQIDMLFPTNGKRALTGISMGGHGAMTLGFKYPKLFSSVASISGVLDIRLHEKQWKIQDVLGTLAQNKASWDKNSAVYLMKNSKKNAFPKQILFSTGLQDIAVLADNQNAQKVLEEKKIPFEYVELEGVHDWVFWKQEVPRHIRKQADFLHL